MKAISERELKKELIQASRKCGAQGWCPGTLGNISVLHSNGKRVFIKRLGADMNRLEFTDIITVDLDGHVCRGKGKPSIETNVHLSIYQIRKDVRTVFHVHPPFATAYAVAGKQIPMVTEAAKIVLGDIPLLPPALPGSLELATGVATSFTDGSVKAVLLRDHGLISVGETFEGAYHLTALVEDTAKIALLSSFLKSEISVPHGP